MGLSRAPAAGADVVKTLAAARDRARQIGLLVDGADLLAAGRWELDRDPYLLETSVPGIFACPMKRVASAVDEGSMAVAFVHQYLGTPKSGLGEVAVPL
jgi:thioredoxin reductase (NADPH)